MKSFLIADILGLTLDEQSESNCHQRAFKRTIAAITGKDSCSAQEREAIGEAKSPAIEKQESLPSWRRKFSEGQTTNLEKVFTKQKYIAGKERAEIAGHLNLTTKQVKTWFQNRRTKWKKERQKNNNYAMVLKNNICFTTSAKLNDEYEVQFQKEKISSANRQFGEFVLYQ
eukprot:gene14084-15555_t